MHITDRMEQFSIAYISALAAKCGCNISVPRVDNDSIDISLQKKYDASPRGRIDIQLKAHGTEPFGEKDSFSFQLKKKNYDDLRADETVPRFLFIVCLPKDIESWLVHSEEQLLLHRCAYWFSLEGFQDTENETSVTLQVPRRNILSPDTLEELMRKSRGVA